MQCAVWLHDWAAAAQGTPGWGQLCLREASCTQGLPVSVAGPFDGSGGDGYSNSLWQPSFPLWHSTELPTPPN